MKLSEKFMKYANYYYIDDYNSEWTECDHFSTRPYNYVFYNGRTEDGYHQFSCRLTRAKWCEAMDIDVNFDKSTGEYVGIEKSLKRPLKDEEVIEFTELITSFFMNMAKHGYLINIC